MAKLDGDKVVASLRGAFARDVGRQGLLRHAAERIRAAGPPYTSVYLYMLHGDDLVLEAYAGRETEHTRISVGQGDIDSDEPDPFTTEEEAEVRKVADALAVLL